jgi:hypothetical protein
VEITDRTLWERELTDHMRWHAPDIQDSPDGTPGVWFSMPLLVLWSVMVMALTSTGWMIGLYFI